MASVAAMSLLQADIGLYSVADPTKLFLEACIDSATEQLAASGVTIDETKPADLMLLTMYAAWLYRKRVNGTAKPPMLAREINNRQVRAASAPEART
jgi:hypothetical protein